MLSAETIAIIKATIPVLQANGETLTRHFYQRMFNANPEVQGVLQPRPPALRQPAAGAGGGDLRVRHAHREPGGPRRRGRADRAEARVARREGRSTTRSSASTCSASIQEVLGDAATDPVINAWGQAYGVLADILIRREAEIYAEHREQHGWDGFKPFVVRRKVRESEGITSFYLTPADGSPVRPFKAGQYVTVRVPGLVARDDDAELQPVRQARRAVLPHQRQARARRRAARCSPRRGTCRTTCTTT